ncbi:MAG: aldo/keto reductase [Ignavibacteriae bacterium]|nr:aldo/keto reductase [Ignavibacteriota bacterium]
MKYRKLGRTGWEVSEISFGAWAIGGDWGNVDDKESLQTLHFAVENGINFFDTADVYGSGKSEKLISQIKKQYKDKIIVATKAGRKLNPHNSEGYNNKKNLQDFIEQSLKNLEVDSLDLLQLHCPPTDVYYMPEVFEYLDDFVKQGKLKFYGVSVEKVEEALKAIEYPNVQTVQIIFNMFRQRPSELFFDQAKKKNVGILARVPLASGLLTGKINMQTEFLKNDHRNYNRNGEAFDKGETFSGVNFDLALRAVEEIKEICPNNFSLSQFALKWILEFDAVTCAIPGGKNVGQVRENLLTSEKENLDERTLDKIKFVYEKFIKPEVHQKW